MAIFGFVVKLVAGLQMPDVRLYIEGDDRPKAPPGGLKEAFRNFFEGLDQSLPDDWNLEIITCGGWPKTLKMFQLGLETHGNDFVVMITDSDAPVDDIELPWVHLHNRDDKFPADEYDSIQCYLMIQATEAWLLADIEKVEEVFGAGFKLEKIRHPNGIETLSPDTMRIQLEAASRHSEKGTFKKRMAYKVLRNIRPEFVRAALPHCDRIFTEIPKAIEQL